jgi:uncharacterized protein
MASESLGHLALKGWYNKPTKKITIKDNKIIVKVPERTDCWRKTRQGILHRTVNNAPFHWQKVDGDFQCIVKVSGNFAVDYDKAGIMVRLDDEHWIFTGMEYCNDLINHSTSVANDHSDWSLSPLPEDSEKTGIYFCFKRIGAVYECFHSMDSLKWIQTRQGLFTEQSVLYVGIAFACPAGSEFRVTFEEYQCNLTKKMIHLSTD